MLETFILFFIGGTVFVIIYFFFLDEDVDPEIQRRLSDLKSTTEKRGSHADSIFSALEQREQSKKANLLEMLNEQSEYRIPVLGYFLNKFQFTEKIKYLLRIADLKMPIDVFLILIASLALPCFLLTVAMKQPFFLVGVIAGAVFPFIYLKMKFGQRMDKFSQVFPDSLGIVSNSLRAGHSLLASFQMVATESAYPVNKLFKNVSDEISLGREMREALEDMNMSLPGNQDLKFFITAVLIQKEIGGNLAEILDTLQHTMRERHKLIGLIKTQTSQAQLSGIILGSAPVAITGMISLVNPEYMEPLFHTSLGHLALFIAFSMSMLGLFVIKKVTEIRV